MFTLVKTVVLALSNYTILGETGNALKQLDSKTPFCTEHDHSA